MPTKKPAMTKVLIVDDDRFMQNVLKRYLTKNYETRTADDGAMGIRLANSWQPNIILLDVEMPGQNGYEVCDQLKNNEATKHIPVVFLSGKSSLRERMLGFEVGADDYLTKPCEPELLHQKINKISQIYAQKAQLADNIANAEKTALEAMTTSFELGKAVRFVELSYGLGDYDSLGESLCRFTQDLSLNSVAMLKCRDKNRFYGSHTIQPSPIEEDLLQMMHSDQRFIDFGCRTLINYPQVALLVKNMPLEDRLRYGRIKDTLPFVLGACDAKLRVLDAEKALKSQHDQLTRSTLSIEGLLEQISKTVSGNQANIRSIMLELTTELGIQLHRMGLQGDQEDFVLAHIEKAANKLHEEANSVDSVEHALSTMVKLLQLLGAEQKIIIERNLSVKQTTASSTMEDIELF